MGFRQRFGTRLSSGPRRVRRKVLSASANVVEVGRSLADSLRSAWTYHRAALSSWYRASLWNRALVALVAVYGVTFSVLTCLRILALSAFAWDLGIYNQAMYTTVTYGRFFAISGLPGNPNATLFGGHFSPILFLLLPVYALLPSPFTLVVVQSWAIAFAAVPVYRLGQRLLPSDMLAFALALVFLLDPATQGVNWFDFHAEAFLLLTLPAMLYFYERGRWKWFLVFVVLSLATIEIAAVLVAVFAIAALAAEFLRSKPRRVFWSGRPTWVLAGVLITAGAWALMAEAVIRAFNPQASLYVAGYGYWDILGATSVTSVPVQVLLHPDRAWAALTFDGTWKLWYLIVLFAPVQLLTWRSPRAILCCLPWLAASLFSNWQPYYLVGNQYPSFVLPFLFYGAIVGLARPWSPRPLVRRVLRKPVAASRPHLETGQYPRVLVGITLVLLIVVSPIGPWAIGSGTTGRAPVLGPHELAVLRLFDLVPADAAVLTQNNLYPLLSSRLNVHFVPVGVGFPPGTSFNATMDAWVSTSDYILIDPQSSFVEAALLLTWPNVTARFSLLAAADGALLLSKTAHSLSYFDPLERSYNYLDVVPQSASIVRDTSAANGYALVHVNGTASHFWYGPFLLLPPGSYTATYRLKVDRLSTGPLLALPIILHPVEIQVQVNRSASGGGEVSASLLQLTSQIYVNTTELTGQNVPSPGTYFTISTRFALSALGVYEFPGHDASGSVTLWFDSISLVQDQPSNEATVPIVWSLA